MTSLRRTRPPRGFRPGPVALDEPPQMFGAELVAASADRGTDRCFDRRRLRPVARGERGDPSLDDAGEEPAPSGVDGGDGARARRDEEDGHAIGGANRQDHIRGGADERVPHRQLLPRIMPVEACPGRIFGGKDVGAVHLARREDDARALAGGDDTAADQVEVERAGAEAVRAPQESVSQPGDRGPLRYAPARLLGHAGYVGVRDVGPRVVAGSHWVIL